MWFRWIVTLPMFLLYTIVNSMPGSSNNYKINPKPCYINSYEGTCMFVWECIKSEGQHIGMCVDSFMFGSCCAHNLTENIVVSQHQPFDFKKPPPKKRPPINTVNRPSLSGMTTIHRPHGGGTLVIRPSHKKRPQPVRPITQKPVIQTTINLSENTVPDLDTASSISTGLWSANSHTTQWHVTTEPNFVTKPRPSTSTTLSSSSSRPKPKPSKPSTVIYTMSTSHQDLVKRPTVTMTTSSSTASTRPKPQIIHTKPTRPSTSTTGKTKPSTSTKLTTSTSTTKPTKSSTSSSTFNIISSSNIVTTKKPTTSSSNDGDSSETTGNDLSSPTDTNDVIETPTESKRYTLSAAKSADCGITSMARPEKRIVGGKNAPFGRWPWQVSVRRTSFFGFSSTHRCGGAVINEWFIATAGHCVDDLLTSQIRIRVGEYDFSHIQEELPFVERAVAKKIVHPKYNFFTYEYDLALVKLDQPLVFAPHIAPICLPATDDLLIGRNATVTGWGRLSEGGTLPSVLQEVSVPIVSNDRCKMMFLRAGRHEFIPDIFLCAGHENGGHDSCQGDSGGPLQVKGKDGHYFLAGIISWGIGCAEANLPGVCTRISKFTSWILENVQ